MKSMKELNKRDVLLPLCTIAGIALTVVSLWYLQRLLVPKYQRGVVEGSMIEEYYDDSWATAKCMRISLLSLCTATTVSHLT